MRTIGRNLNFRHIIAKCFLSLFKVSFSLKF
jgi:hypothetical protein